MNQHRAEGVLLTGVYGSGKSSVAVEIAYLLEQRGEPYALLDLDYLSWAGDDLPRVGLTTRGAASVLTVRGGQEVTLSARRGSFQPGRG